MIKRVAIVVFMLFGLSGCYMPASFDAEIEISRSGYYKIVFDGYIAEINLFNEIRAGKLTPQQEAEKVKLIKADFERDPSTKEVSYYRQGHFKVVWEKSGDILVSKMVTFVRRNENMFSISYNKEKAMVTMRGASVSKSNAKRLTAAGLRMRGRLRVKTDARVLRQNADKVINGKGRQKIYIWYIKSLYSPAPILTFTLR